MNLGLQGKVVLVTGAGSGIGQGIAAAFAAEGANVLVNDIDAAGIEATLAQIRAAGGDAAGARCDIADLAAVQAMAAAAGRIDILVNNAALIAANAPFVETRPEDCEREIRVALFGTMHCCRAVLPGMIERRYGRIVNIVTDAARVGQEREASYSAAKGGVISFTKSLAREVGRHGVNVNAVSPAATDTPLRRQLLARMAGKLGQDKVDEREEKVRRAYPLKRIGEVRDVADSVVFLASDAARHITGQILSVNGGFAMPG